MPLASRLLRTGAAVALSAGAVAVTAAETSSNTLETVRERDTLRCGTTTGFAGFSSPDDQGNWRGLDVDLCRAIAAAVLGDAAKFEAVPLNAQQRFTALQSGEIDVLTRNTTVTQQRETSLGLLGAGINFYDGQGFLAPRALEVTSATQLDGATICLQTGTTNEGTLADWARAHDISYKPVVIEKFDEVINAFVSGRCDVFSTDASGLASIRSSRLPDPDAYVVLPEIISKEPLGPYVRQGDDQWLNIVKYSLHAMIAAEEYGITQANVDERRDDPSPTIQRLLGTSGDTGKTMGLDEAWAYNIIKQVGNYGESFERHLGMSSPLRIERGLNAQWEDGGLMYALPIR